MKKAFTLIELLVVIAIIAILAAILFPVFAQAKQAAKKTVSLSNIKQINLSTLIYTTDNDDTFPLTEPFYQGEYLNDATSVPFDWQPGMPQEYYDTLRVLWANSLQSYIKNWDIYELAGQKVIDSTVGSPVAPGRRKVPVNYGINGLLHAYSLTAVTAPASLIAFGQPLGDTAALGFEVHFPMLYCRGASCRYVPSKPGCNGGGSGASSYALFDPRYGVNARAAFGNGSNFAYADGHAKFQNMNRNVNGKTDFKTDPYSHYDAQGNALYGWVDGNGGCHALLYQPDFDFQNWGTPAEAGLY